MNLIDLKRKDSALAAAGAVIGLSVGFINGYISGDRGMALLEGSGAGDAAGGLIGLTDGLSLLEGVKRILQFPWTQKPTEKELTTDVRILAILEKYIFHLSIKSE